MEAHDGADLCEFSTRSETQLTAAPRRSARPALRSSGQSSKGWGGRARPTAQQFSVSGRTAGIASRRGAAGRDRAVGRRDLQERPARGREWRRAVVAGGERNALRTEGCVVGVRSSTPEESSSAAPGGTRAAAKCSASPSDRRTDGISIGNRTRRDRHPAARSLRRLTRRRRAGRPVAVGVDGVGVGVGNCPRSRSGSSRRPPESSTPTAPSASRSKSGQRSRTGARARCQPTISSIETLPSCEPVQVAARAGARGRQYAPVAEPGHALHRSGRRCPA
jgi:hypothetical protein